MNEQQAKELDKLDPLRCYRDQFLHPKNENGDPLIYLSGHSLGLQPKGVVKEVDTILKQWANKGVEQWFDEDQSWLLLYPSLKQKVAKLVGASADEVTVMNSLTVNLHLLLASFFRPSKERFKIMIESPTFPSDRFAVESHLEHHGIDPRSGVVTVLPKNGEALLTLQDFATALKKEGDQIALLWISGVNYLTGQALDIQKITDLAHSYGCKVGIDLAHAIGNIELELHRWGVDFAVWCHYKYLNSGPGAVGGAFIHEKYCNESFLPQLKGWWGVDLPSRFEMDRFIPARGADRWQLSTPSLLSVAPLMTSLELFDKAGMRGIREKSLRLTACLEKMLRTLPAKEITLITPKDPNQRGAQLSLEIKKGGEQCLTFLRRRGIICDFRTPNMIRVAPMPLYNMFHELFQFVQSLAEFFYQ